MANHKKYALIGSGMMGCEHIENLKLVDGAELVAIAEPNAEPRRWAEHTLGPDHGVRFYDDHQSLIGAEALDAVIIATPNFTHHDIVRDLAPHPIAILVEKPMATTAGDAAAMLDLANMREHLFWVGLEYRYMPPVSQFIDRVHRGDVGKVRMLSIREHRFPFLQKVDDWNRFNRNTGGTLVEKCCHFFDLMRLILRAEPVRVFASGGVDVNHLDERYNGEIPDIIDNALVVVDFDNATRASLDLCMFAEGSREQEDICVVGDTAKLEVGIPSGIIRTSPRDRSGWRDEHVTVSHRVLRAGSHHGATFYQLSAFHQALVTNAPPTVNARDGLMSVRMGLAAQDSIATGRAVTLST